MENKYYIPTLEEFYIGFELEHYYYDRDGGSLNLENSNYRPTVVKSKRDIPADDKGCAFFRVKYLDKEDIESLGFSVCTTSSGVYYDNEDYTIKYARDKRLIISKKDKDGALDMFGEHKENILFFGNVKNKSELKKLMKQLNMR